MHTNKQDAKNHCTTHYRYTGLAQAHPKNIDGYDTIYNSTKHVEFAHEAMVQ